VNDHQHVLVPVKLVDRSFHAEKAGPIEWTGPWKAYGQINDVGLTGQFLVEIEFKNEEFRSWLTHYVREQPEDAIRLLDEKQTEAILALHRRPHTADPK
jgi:hypothetical protein